MAAASGRAGAPKALAAVAFGAVGLSRASSTSAVLGLHAAPHDLATYDFQPSALLHAGILLSWDSLSLRAGAAFSNFGPWAGAPAGGAALLLAPAPLPGQELLAAAGARGAPITSGVFSPWAAAGLAACAQLQLAACAALLAAAAGAAAAYFHLHLCGGGLASPSRRVALPGLLSLARGAAPARPNPAAPHLISGGTLSTAAAAAAAHHLSVGVRLAWAAARAPAGRSYAPARAQGTLPRAQATLLPRARARAAGAQEQLAVRLALAGGASLWHAAALLALPAFPALLAAGVEAWALFAHHTCAGLLLILGSASHATVAAVRGAPRPAAQRDVLHGHLGWTCALVGCHSLGLYVHDDSALALGRAFDGLADDALQLRPLAALWWGRACSAGLLAGGDGFACTAPAECSTADFLLAHIHALGAHVLAFILCKGPLFAADSRPVPHKGQLGFRFPCDGPGRGGSCQVSAWDHAYLGAFWAHNLLSAALFGAFWKAQGSLLRLASGYGLHAGYVQGWLRDFLWAGAAQALQGYGEARAPSSLAFLAGHFAWALSLMFLFSGRGYWQELAELVVWAHAKLGVAPALQPRALSITQGRAAGAAHFLLGGTGASWAFSLARLVA